MSGERPGPERAAAVLVVLAELVVLVVYLVPEHTRRLWAMRAAAWAARSAGRAAAWAGRRAMADELAGGAGRYELPVVLSRARDAAWATYERMRPS